MFWKRRHHRKEETHGKDNYVGEGVWAGISAGTGTAQNGLAGFF